MNCARSGIDNPWPKKLSDSQPFTTIIRKIAHISITGYVLYQQEISMPRWSKTAIQNGDGLRESSCRKCGGLTIPRLEMTSRMALLERKKCSNWLLFVVYCTRDVDLCYLVIYMRINYFSTLYFWNFLSRLHPQLFSAYFISEFFGCM